ncbi:hypothetical protein KAURM247S_00791 [Kitasatospora aureofaciens]
MVSATEAEATSEPRLVSQVARTRIHSAIVGPAVTAISSPPATSTSMPVMRTGRGVYLPIRRPARTTAPATSSVPGRYSRPIVRGDSVRTTLPNCPRAKLNPAAMKFSVRLASAATVNALLWNSDGSRTGSVARRSWSTNSTPAIALITRGSQAWSRVMPFSASAMPWTRVSRPHCTGGAPVSGR